MRSVALNGSITFPYRDSRQNAPGLIVLDMGAVEAESEVQLNLTMIVTPVQFERSDGAPGYYSIGCREACVQLAIIGGKMALQDETESPISFERTLGSNLERGPEVRPKIEGKVGSEGVGVGAEVGAYISKTVKGDWLTVKGTDDTYRVKRVERIVPAWVQWTITVSPLAPASKVLQCSHRANVACKWVSVRQGGVRLFASHVVRCHGTERVSGPGSLLARFAHWVKGVAVYNSLKVEWFEVEGAKP
jgi:hypothetical protein